MLTSNVCIKYANVKFGWNKNTVSDNFTERYDSVSYLVLDIMGTAGTF